VRHLRKVWNYQEIPLTVASSALLGVGVHPDTRVYHGPSVRDLNAQGQIGLCDVGDGKLAIPKLSELQMRLFIQDNIDTRDWGPTCRFLERLLDLRTKWVPEDWESWHALWECLIRTPRRETAHI